MLRLIRCGWPLLLASALAGSALANPAPDVVLTGTITGRDHQQYLQAPFEVPAGTTRISVAFEYSGRDRKTTVDLGLLGPDGMLGKDGFRGWSGGNKQQFTVSASDATPSYLPGPITPGRWTLLLGIPNARANADDRYQARIWFGQADTPPWLPAELNPPLRPQPGWYRGDLHLHDAHSDGGCANSAGNKVPCPLFLTAQAALQRGLDFVAITDHNTMSQANAIRELQPYFDSLLLLPGREITTFSGHANLWGPVAAIDFRVGSPSVPDWNQLAQTVAPLQGVLSINHPIRPSDETCMGCGWTAEPAIDPSLLQAVEVVNGMDADTAYSGIPFWESLLNAGHRLTAIGGSDNHDAGQHQSGPGGGSIGSPTTVVHASALSMPALLRGIADGNVFVDVQGSRDRWMALQASVGARSVAMGGMLAAAAGDSVRLHLHSRQLAGGSAQLLLDGQPAPALTAALQTAMTDGAAIAHWTSDGKRHWLRIDIRGPQGELWLLGNPIYINWPTAAG